MSLTLIIVTTLLMLPGIAAIAFMLPGIPYIFAISLIYAFIDGFQHVSVTDMVILGCIALLSIVIDQATGLIAAHYGGARGKTFLYGMAGAIIGTIIVPLFGGFIGLFVGIVVGEVIRKRSHKEAIVAATAGVIGSVTGIIINICLSIVFIGLFLWFAFF